MYNYRAPKKTGLKINKSYTGERLEQKVARILYSKEPITDGAPLIYTERSEGVLPDFDIRTDKMDAAIDAMDKVEKIYKARRQDRIEKNTGDKAAEGMKKEKGGGTTSEQGTA